MALTMDGGIKGASHLGIPRGTYKDDVHFFLDCGNHLPKQVATAQFAGIDNTGGMPLDPRNG